MKVKRKLVLQGNELKATKNNIGSDGLNSIFEYSKNKKKDLSCLYKY